MELTYEPDANALRLQLLPGEAHQTIPAHGQLDIGEAGRLLGIEIVWPSGSQRITLSPRLASWVSQDETGCYLSFAPESVARADQSARSFPIQLMLELDAHGQLLAVVVPRRGPGYEISYPSGNT
ncbi:DUF2283 domain-containing protein [Thermorudis peleae]|uniref:DUF2283 domain-containing protein n=1 Tax=Thermorudis peleae TaxID=1382356 RepID=UPI000571F951|nr:DUF2283 domain-containing protein [Thermorudis peleae]